MLFLEMLADVLLASLPVANSQPQNALPDRRIFAKVWSRTETPVNAVILTVIVATIFGLLYLASYVAVSICFHIKDRNFNFDAYAVADKCSV